MGYLRDIQTLFVSLLKVWIIPIVIMLSIASGFTTYYGLAHFIISWIALVITIAIQSIIVICSLEIAGIHWRANRLRYLATSSSLIIALAASISFSYFKFYEISQQDDVHIKRLNQIRTNVKSYLKPLLVIKYDVLERQQSQLKQLSNEVSQAYFGTHPLVSGDYKNRVGEGPFWKQYNKIYQEKKLKYDNLILKFTTVDNIIYRLQGSLNDLDVADNLENSYYKVLKNYQDLQLQASSLLEYIDLELPEAGLLMTYKQFIADVKPSVSMWHEFSLFAFMCAAMVDFFTVLLSYRLEFSVPRNLTIEEEDLVFECLEQFTEFTINANNELQMVIEKTAIEKARRYSDLTRMFAVGLLLSRGFLRKIDYRTVEFSAQLYPLIAGKMQKANNQLKTPMYE